MSTKRRAMPSVSIQKVRKPEAAPVGILEPVSGLFEEVRRRAYELFERRGYADGWEREDWLRAERELLWSPLSEVVETDKEIQVRVAAPGMEATDLQVTATPDWLMVQGATSTKREKQAGTVRFSEFRGRKLYRRLELPAPIDVETTKARLEKGILDIRAVKAGTTVPVKKAVKKKAVGA
jgi:HSP20 family molecular chaperone IbpA